MASQVNRVVSPTTDQPWLAGLEEKSCDTVPAWAGGDTNAATQPASTRRRRVARGGRMPGRGLECGGRATGRVEAKRRRERLRRFGSFSPRLRHSTGEWSTHSGVSAVLSSLRRGVAPLPPHSKARAVPSWRSLKCGGAVVEV